MFQKQSSRTFLYFLAWKDTWICYGEIALLLEMAASQEESSRVSWQQWSKIVFKGLRGLCWYLKNSVGLHGQKFWNCWEIFPLISTGEPKHLKVYKHQNCSTSSNCVLAFLGTRFIAELASGSHQLWHELWGQSCLEINLELKCRQPGPIPCSATAVIHG